jgi:uncharacterized membrane protein YqjE
MAAPDRSVAEILQDILRNFQEIVRSEVRLAKAEVREEVSKTRSAGLLVGAGAVCGFFAIFFFLLMVVYALAKVIPDWAAALIVFVILAVAAAVTLNVGFHRFKRVQPVPAKTIESVKENVEWAKQQIK